MSDLTTPGEAVPSTREIRDLTIDRNMLTGELILIDAPPVIDIPDGRVPFVEGVATFHFSNATVRYKKFGQTANVLHAERCDLDAFGRGDDS